MCETYFLGAGRLFPQPLEACRVGSLLQYPRDHVFIQSTDDRNFTRISGVPGATAVTRRRRRRRSADALLVPGRPTEFLTHVMVNRSQVIRAAPNDQVVWASSHRFLA